ncbi:MAG: family 16 glycoside hydrolase [Akkermansiaceae bacterium]
MKHALFRTIALSLLAPALLAAPEELFNGKDLTGWNGNPEFWKVADGVIVGETTAEKPTKGNTFLIHKGKPVGDFELTLTLRLIGNNNSGIQYRSKVRDEKTWSVGGYQMDIHPSANYVGMMYEERGRGIVAQRGQKVKIGADGKKEVTGEVDKGRKIDIAQWNDYSVVAKGNVFTHKVNGDVTAIIIDEEEAKRSMSGVLALQLHAGRPMRVEIKDIVLTRHPSKASSRISSKSKTRTIANPKSAKTGAANPPAANWIWLSKDARTGTVYFRKQWTTASKVKSAKLTITADNSFTAFVNGKEVGSGNNWNTRYQFDVTKHLRLGDNVLAVRAGNEGSIAGLAAQLDLESDKGQKVRMVTDKSWKSTDQKREGWMAPGIKRSGWREPFVHGSMGMAPWGDVFSGQVIAKSATIAAPKGEAVAHPKGFEVEKIYTVPKGEQGSWVSMAIDDKGRLYCSDQGKQGIYRITLGNSLKIEKLPAPISGGHGLLWAFDSLYVCVNGGGVGGHGSGLYRLTDSNNDDQLDKVQPLRGIQGGGEHGPHAVVLSPDGKSLFVLGGNHTKPPKPELSAVVPNYGEDQLLPRMTDARGHARGIRAPGGWIAQTDPEGTKWKFYSTGFRNQYDVAFNSDGEMFTFDSDMEWDSGTPWYRPTRIYHCTSGSEFGWRTGTGKFPAWYPDVLPPTLDIGPGCPTGVMSGQGANFPADYQHAIYAFDWTYGTIYAIHLVPQGSSYTAVKEEFVTGIPLNVTDGVIGKDGNMYFAVGGRGTQSALYRVSYKGRASTERRFADNKFNRGSRMLRKQLEKYHGVQVAGAVDKIWPHLGNKDRFIRYAARVALEHQPVSDWAAKALGEKDLQTALSALLALSRQGNASQQDALLLALQKVSSVEMSEAQQLEGLRIMSLSFIRMGKPGAATAGDVIKAISPLYPAKTDALNRELVALLVYLGSPEVAAKTVPLLSQEAIGLEEIEFDDNLLKRSGGYGKSFLNQKANNPQRQQIHYAYALKNVANGWTPELRKDYFKWFAKSRNFQGGASFGGFIENFRKESLAQISDQKERAEMDALSKKPVRLVPEGYEAARKIEIGVLRGMKFDKEILEAKAGERIAIVLTNNDPDGLMHNLAVIKPGTRQEVIEATLKLGPKAIEKNFVPDIPAILGSTPQVAPGRRFTLYLTAPAQAGDYPYVCTYPGHGQLMFGTLKVK